MYGDWSFFIFKNLSSKKGQLAVQIPINALLVCPRYHYHESNVGEYAPTILLTEEILHQLRLVVVSPIIYKVLKAPSKRWDFPRRSSEPTINITYFFQR